MIRFWSESKKLGNMKPVEKAMGQAMPETGMSEMVNPGKTIAQQERVMPHKRHHRKGNKGVLQPRPTGMMKPIPYGKHPETTGILWEHVLEKDACRTEMRGTSWTECICLK
jgi:hypothetical protein